MMRRLVRLGSALAVLGAAHSLYNIRRLRVPAADPPAVSEPIALLLPVRNEAKRVEACLRSLMAQRDVPHLQIVVLDDESDDDTADVGRAIAGADARVRVIPGVALPADRWGKPHACQQLADAALDSPTPPTVLVFVDADVVLEDHAVASAVTLLRESGLDLISPYPRQLAITAAERLVQRSIQSAGCTGIA